MIRAMASLACIITMAASSAFAQETQILDYDVHGRLVSAYRDRPAGSTVTTYALDGADNRAARSSGPAMTASWEAENLPHVVGFAEADGWAANINQPQHFMTYGPYTPEVPVGQRVAVWRMMVEWVDVSGSSSAVVLDVYDATTGEVLAIRGISHASWRTPWTYQWFELPFEMSASRAGHLLEFRTWFVPIAHVRVDKIGYR